MKLKPGETVTILRPGYHGATGIYKGRARDQRIIVDVCLSRFQNTKLHLFASEVRRVQTSGG